MDQQREPYTRITESLDFISDPLYEYRRAAEAKGHEPRPVSVVSLLGQAARRFTSLFHYSHSHER